MANQVFQQDGSEKERPGAVFMISLLMKEPAKLPNKEKTVEIMKEYMGDVDCFWYDEEGAGFAANNYVAQFKDASLPPQLMISSCAPIEEGRFSEFEKSQMWDCMKDRDRIFEECQYQVFANDMLAAALPYKERAALDMDFMEALVALFPQCEAVFFQNSGKLFLADTIRNHQLPRESRFVYFAVNARFFNIENSDDMIVDTIGMNTLLLPDLQYHFHDLDPNQVVNHAYTIASYLYNNDNPIKEGDTIDGMIDGQLVQQIQWACQYEDALVQPVREVIDICMGEFASGNRGE